MLIIAYVEFILKLSAIFHRLYLVLEHIAVVLNEQLTVAKMLVTLLDALPKIVNALESDLGVLTLRKSEQFTLCLLLVSLTTLKLFFRLVLSWRVEG